MFLNLILLLISIAAILFLLREIRKSNIDQFILPECKFTISKPTFEINENEKIARYSLITKNKDRYFRDFPIEFKFHSDQKFRSKIKITYTISRDDDVEIIYDRVVEFEDTTKEHIYYINDVIIGSIDIEILTDTQYGNPVIDFEVLQNNMCHLYKKYKIEIAFPE